MKFSEPFPVRTANLAPAGNLKRHNFGSIVTIDVRYEMIIFFRLYFVCFVDSCVKRNSQLKNVNSFFLFIHNNNVWYQTCDTKICRNGAIGRSGEARDIAVDSVDVLVEQTDDVVEDVVVSPGVTSLIEICRATVQYMKGVLPVTTMRTTIGWYFFH